MTEREEIIIAFQLGADDPNYTDQYADMRIHEQVSAAAYRHLGREAVLVLAFVSGMRSISPHNHVEEIEEGNILADILELVNTTIQEREK